MSANIESMFYTREVPWHGLGINVSDILTSEEALRAAGLDWMVEQVPIYAARDELVGPDGISYGHTKVDGWFANMRSTDNAVLGLVSKQYKIIQNKDAFDFTDELVGMDGGAVKYETAGSLNGGKTVWLLARLPEYMVLGDRIDPFLAFTNSYDGKNSAKAFMTPVRVVCQNTLNLAIRQARRMWSTAHVGDITGKMEEARNTLQLSELYMKHLSTEAERLAALRIPDSWLDQFLAQMFPTSEGFSDVRNKMAEQSRQLLRDVYMHRDDLGNFRGNGWGLLNAVAEVADHRPFGPTTTVTQRTYERKFESIISGADLLDQAYSILSGEAA